MRARHFLSGGWLSVYAFLYIVFLYLPVIFLPIFSVDVAPTPKFPLTGFTLQWYADLPHTPALLDAAWNSLKVGVCASVLATVLGILAARSITRYRYPGRRTINGLIMAPLVLPEVIVAISMLLVMLQLGLSLSQGRYKSLSPREPLPNQPLQGSKDCPDLPLRPEESSISVRYRALQPHLLFHERQRVQRFLSRAR